MTDNSYTYKTRRGRVRGAFNIYQARNGRIYLAMGNRYTELSHQQVHDLMIDVFELADFDYDDYKKAYEQEEP